MQRCVLCGCERESSTPLGALVYCALHARKSQKAHDLFSVEEARKEGQKRVSSLSLEQIRQEGAIAYGDIKMAEETVRELMRRAPKESEYLRDFFLRMIAAKRAYLSAFD